MQADNFQTVRLGGPQATVGVVLAKLEGIVLEGKGRNLNPLVPNLGNLGKTILDGKILKDFVA